MRRLAIFLIAVGCGPDMSVDYDSEEGEATVTRPLSDFVNTQGTFCFPDGAGGCVLFDAPVPNYLFFKNSATLRCVAIDYAGIVSDWLEGEGGPSLGTSSSGSVKEKALPNGTAEVKVNITTSNAFTWVMDDCVGTALGATLFGYTRAEVLAGATPALGSASLNIKFINPAPGAPLADLIQLSFLPQLDSRLVSLLVTASASGDLRAASGFPEGTDGSTRVTLINLPSIGAPNAFPVDNVMLND